MLVYKHTETVEYIKNKPTSRVSNSRILGIKDAKVLGYGFYMNPSI